MLPTPTSAAKCLNSLLRFELAVVRCYRFAEQLLGDHPDRAALARMRAAHEAAAADLTAHIAAHGQSPSHDPGLWGSLISLAETSAVVFGRHAILTVLLWAEQHARDTYRAARREWAAQPGDPGPILEPLAPAAGRHVAALEAMLPRHKAAPADACASEPVGV